MKIEYRDFDQLIGCLYLKDIGQQKKRRGMKRVVYVCIFVNADAKVVSKGRFPPDFPDDLGHPVDLQLHPSNLFVPKRKCIEKLQKLKS